VRLGVPGGVLSGNGDQAFSVRIRPDRRWRGFLPWCLRSMLLVGARYRVKESCPGSGSLAGCLGDDLLGHVGRNLRVGVELHRVVRTTLGLGPQVADIPEHLRQRYESL